MLAVLDRGEAHHGVVVEILEQMGDPFLVPAATLGELGHFLEHRFPSRARRAFLSDLASGAWSLDCGESDLGRVAELTNRYDDLPLGLVDAAVIACAERSGGDVLSLDDDFHIVAAEETITVLP